MKKWKQIPKWAKTIFVCLLFLIISEMTLRFCVGLGDLAVYREDSDYEYFYEPNQDVWRFGNHIVTNEYGMRSKPVNKKKRITVLEFGDSVLNGGAHVDQDNLSTTIQEKELNEKYKDEVQVLNVSAQSWGVSNAFAFLKKHGDFKADVIVLVFSSHDLYDNMHFRKVVGEQLAWPADKPLLALTDAWSRFVWPPVERLFTGEKEYGYLDGFDDSQQNKGWMDFFNYCRKENIPLVVYLHASQEEIRDGKYDEKGSRIIQLCKKNGIGLIKDLGKFNESGNGFSDPIHLNASGHKWMAELIVPEVEKALDGKENRKVMNDL